VEWEEQGFEKELERKERVWSRIATRILALPPDSIQSSRLNQNNTVSYENYFFNQIIITFKIQYIAIYSLQHVHHTCNYW